jgi:hypothetical protein
MPYLGMTVVFYEQADAGPDNGHKADVVWCDESGQCELSVSYRGNPQLVTKRNVYPMGHKALENARQRQDFGAWDSPKNHHARAMQQRLNDKYLVKKQTLAKELRIKLINTPATQKEVETVTSFYRQGMTPGDISEQMGPNFPFPRIQKILRETGMVPV